VFTIVDSTIWLQSRLLCYCKTGGCVIAKKIKIISIMWLHKNHSTWWSQIQQTKWVFWFAVWLQLLVSCVHNFWKPKSVFAARACVWLQTSETTRFATTPLHCNQGAVCLQLLISCDYNFWKPLCLHTPMHVCDCNLDSVCLQSGESWLQHISWKNSC
jgi:hypothetical protein